VTCTYLKQSSQTTEMPQRLREAESQRQSPLRQAEKQTTQSQIVSESSQRRLWSAVFLFSDLDGLTRPTEDRRENPKLEGARMADSPATQRAEAVTAAAAGIKHLDTAAQVAAVTAVIGPPGEQASMRLWTIVVSGLLVLLVIALGGLIYLVADGISGSDVVLTVFTSALTGLLGLFAPSPGNSSTT
jgi:hypothetical protein